MPRYFFDTSSPTLFEEPPHAGAEALEDAGKDEFVLGSQCPRRVVGAGDMGGLRLGIKNHDHQDAGAQVFCKFLMDAEQTIACRSHLNVEFWHFGSITRRQRALGESVIAIIGNVSPTHRIGIMLGDHAGIVTHYAAEVTFLDEVAE